MQFLDKLEWLMKRDGLNKHTLAAKSKVPYTTLVGLYERGVNNARISTLNRLCECFNVSLDYLVIDEYDKPDDFVPNGNHIPNIADSEKERALIASFRSLNQEGQEKMLEYADDLLKSGKYIKTGKNQLDEETA